ncbi:MAG: MFS transporter [Cyanobacteria bacterium]|nr:MFS transporter [Cyanobacteriota bacterium]
MIGIEASSDQRHKTTPSGGVWAGVNKYHLIVFLGCWFGGIFDGMDSNLFSVMLPNAIQDLAHTDAKSVISQLGSQVTSVFLVGWMLGGVIFGIVGDKLGRVKSMVLSILLYAIFTGAAGFAQDPFQLGLCRFLTGLGIGGELVSIATLLSETWPERSRALAVGALITSYQIGVLCSAIITTYVHDWRTVFFVGALPAVLAIFLQLQLHEPEKWKKDKEKQEAENALQQSNAPQHSEVSHTNAPIPRKQGLFGPSTRGNVILGSIAFGSLLIGYWASLSWIPTWIHDLLGNQSNGTEKSIATIYHAIAAILGCLLSGVLADSIGRRYTIMISCVGSFAASALLFMTNTQFSEMIYWQDAMLGFFIGLMQAVMYIYLPELFPTRLRATAVGFCLNAGRFSAAIAALYVGTLVAFFGGYAEALMAFSVPYLVGLIAAGIGKETKGQELPD